MIAPKTQKPTPALKNSTVKSNAEEKGENEIEEENKVAKLKEMAVANTMKKNKNKFFSNLRLSENKNQSIF